MRKILYSLAGMLLGSGLLATLDTQAATVEFDPFLPSFNAANFDLDSSISDNPFFPLVPGTRFVYEGKNSDGELESNKFFVTFGTKDILGVTTRVVRDTAYVDGVKVEDTFDWFAQDTEGNVWYLGEFVTNFEYDNEGNLIETNNNGSWQAGVNGALPGYIMEANSQIGDNYYQELAPNDRALDQALVFSKDESISIGLGNFDNVLKILEATDIEPGILGAKNYASGIGLISVEENLDMNLEPEFTTELVRVERVSVPEPSAVLGLLGVGWFCLKRRRSKANTK
jgi:hypothetical protein